MNTPTPRSPTSSTAHDMALKIGLDVVPKKKGLNPTAKNKKKKKKKKTRHKIPTIAWGSKVERFFWKQNQRNATKDANEIIPIANKEAFPLYLLPNVLPPTSLARALSLSHQKIRSDEAEEMEQHEIVSAGKKVPGKKVRVLRRSLVSRLVYSNNNEQEKKDDLLDMIVARLPTELVDEGACDDDDDDDDDKNNPHPYEDGSVVYYRTTQNDFYDTHHDSYSPEDNPPRKRHRAYTILLYLRSPSGPPCRGGTEFPRLTPCLSTNTTDGMITAASRNNQEDGKGLIVKPRPGDALVWPNFDREGKPYMDSVHRALPLLHATRRTSEEMEKTAGGSGMHDDDVGKVVINLWFQGARVTSNPR